MEDVSLINSLGRYCDSSGAGDSSCSPEFLRPWATDMFRTGGLCLMDSTYTRDWWRQLPASGCKLY